MSAKIGIEVAYATPHKQIIVECEVDAGTAPRDAVRGSGIVEHFPEIDVDRCDLGVFGKAIDEEYHLNPGDRIEIYRPLLADPKEIRRQRAARGLAMKKGGGAVNPE